MTRHLVISFTALSLFALSGFFVTRSPASDAPPRADCAVVLVQLDEGYSVSRTEERVVCD